MMATREEILRAAADALSVARPRTLWNLTGWRATLTGDAAITLSGPDGDVTYELVGASIGGVR